MDSSGLEEQIAGSCGRGEDLLRSINDSEIIDQLSNC
jgi:hypothetical protein